MSSVAETAETGAEATEPAAPPAQPPQPGHDEGHEHPRDIVYVKVAIVLAVLTAMEISTYFFEDELGMAGLLAILLPLMTLKFWYVAAFFMHLKFDSPLFTKMFGAGIAFAVGVYVVMLAMFHFWV